MCPNLLNDTPNKTYRSVLNPNKFKNCELSREQLRLKVFIDSIPFLGHPVHGNYLEQFKILLPRLMSFWNFSKVEKGLLITPLYLQGQ